MIQMNSPSQNFGYQNVLFVSDLPRETTEEDLTTFFKKYHVVQTKVHL